ncbi:MAG TPA: hypothetical protein VGN11_08435 [Candidatus Baltobacteraceae bacterium]|jgi:hypothetical protein|nr:hypothetical protein [Candidatus Baltobacteraceae bacterium]
MTTIDEAMRLEDHSGTAEMTFELAVLEDACDQANVYWANWLWGRPQPPTFQPGSALCEKLAPCDECIIASVWSKWFAVLTAWDFVDALIGKDVRGLLDDRPH